MKKNKSLRPGKYRIEVVGADGLKLDTDKFEIASNGKASVRVTVEAPALATKQDTGTDGPISLALKYSKPGEYVDSDFTLAIGEPWTIEGWVQPTEPVPAKGKGYLIFTCEDFGIQLAHTSDKGLRWRVQCRDAQGNAYDSDREVVPGNWSHLALVNDGENLSLFVDGVLQGRPLAHQLAKKDLQVGLGPYQFYPGFCGLIGPIRVSSVARYRANFKPSARFKNDVDTLVLFHCDEGSGDKLTDSAGNGHHGKIVGAKWMKVDSIVPQSADSDRKAAEWALSIGGKVAVRVGDKEYDAITTVRDLPAEPLRVLRIDLTHTYQASDAGLAQLKSLSILETLSLNGSPVTNAGLAHLKTLTNLKSLGIMGSRQVDDAGMEHIKDLPKLSNLWLSGTNVGNAGLEHLKSMSNLENLNLSSTKVSDAGLAHLKAHTKLNYLMLYDTAVTNAGLEQLKPLTSLWTLRIGKTSVGDAGLEHLKALTNLTDLGLEGNQVTDRGLEHLKALPNLKSLSLQETKVTAEGVKKLAAALPQCKIEWDGDTIEPRK